MSFLNNSIIYHIAIILYACSISLYFIDYFQSNRKANRFAFWLLAIVWVLQSIFMLLRATDSETNPILTLLSGIYFYVWLLITMSLVINRFMRIDFLVFFYKCCSIWRKRFFYFYTARKDVASTCGTISFRTCIRACRYGNYFLRNVYCIVHFFYYVFIAISPIKKEKMECEIKKVREFTEARIYVLRIKFIFCSIFLTSNFIRMYMGIYKIG